MNVKLAILADYANITAEGKLNILGIFDRINVAKLPAVHPQMQLVLRLQAHRAEAGDPHPVDIRFHDPDGQTIFDIQGEVVPPGGAPGPMLASNQIITINNLQLSTEGEHNVVVFVDGDLKAEVPLVVKRASGSPPGPAQPPDARGQWDA